MFNIERSLANYRERTAEIKNYTSIQTLLIICDKIVWILLGILGFGRPRNNDYSLEISDINWRFQPPPAWKNTHEPIYTVRDRKTRVSEKSDQTEEDTKSVRCLILQRILIEFLAPFILLNL